MPDNANELRDSSPSDTLASHTNTDSHIAIATSAESEIRLSKRRWLVLLAFTLFGFTGGLVDTLGPILHTMLQILDLPLDKYVYIGQTFAYLPVILAVPTAWFIDKYGLRWTMYMAAFLVLIRNSSKALLFNPDLPDWGRLKMVYWIISGFAGGQLISMFYCLPLKISENWFSTSERSIAWTVMIASSEVGASIASFTLPRYITDINHVKPLFLLNLICAAVSAVAVFTCITKSQPNHPANERMAKVSNVPSIPFFKSLKTMVTHKDIMLHVVYLAIYEAGLVSVLMLIQDILTSSGHREVFAGDVQAVNSIFGVVVLIGSSFFVHRVQDTTLACKLSAVVNVVIFVTNLTIIVPHRPEWLVMAFVVVSCIAQSWVRPTYNNMTAHLVCGTVSQATISGFVTTMVIVLLTGHNVMFVSLIDSNSGKNDYTRPAIFASILQLLNTAVYVTFFRGQPSTQEVDVASTDEPATLNGISGHQSMIGQQDSYSHRWFDRMKPRPQSWQRKDSSLT